MSLTSLFEVVTFAIANNRGLFIALRAH